MIAVSEPQLGGRELEYLAECVRTGWVSSAGRFIEEFEERWTRYCGRRHGVAVSSGTAALQVAVRCLNLCPGDEVIMPTFTIISCAQAVLYAGGTPVLVDSEPATWCMDTRQVEERITPRTRAIMAVHIYGHPVDMDPIEELARRHGLAVVEDAAEAHGAEYLAGRHTPTPAWRRCGGMGTLSVFSFYANKLITTGEGGMILCDDPVLAERARSLRNLCFESRRRFLHEELGFNFRMTNLQAALGVAQIERIDAIVERKRWIGRAYGARLCRLPGIELPREESWARHVFWMYGLVLHEERGIGAAELAARLRAHGVETRPFFLGMHEQPALRRRGLFEGEQFPVATRLARQGLYLPSGVGLAESQIDQVCQAVERSLA
jgi:perosamine synthetase